MSLDASQARSDAWTDMWMIVCKNFKISPMSPRGAPPYLPNELSMCIVSILQDIWIAKSSDDIGWINVTFVCRAWRTIAVTTPSLWTTVDLYLGADWAIAFLERARSTPISLAILTEAEQDEPGETVTALGAYYGGRPWPLVRSIYFPWETQGFAVSELPMSVYRNTSLQSLTISSNYFYGNNDLDERLVFWGSEGNTFDFWDLLPSTLVKLELVGLVSETLGPVALGGLAPFLARSLKLRTFSICPAYLDNLTISDHIRLPALRDLTIAAMSAAHCLPLLKALAYPGSISQLAFDIGSFDVPELVNIFQCVHPPLTPASEELYTVVGVGPLYSQFVVAASRVPDPPGVMQQLFEAEDMLRKSYASLDPSFCFAVDENDNDAFESMCPVIHCLNLTGVRTLHFHNFHPALVDISYYFGSARLVEDLYLAGPDMCSVLVALGMSVICSAQEEESNPPLGLLPVLDAADMLFPRLQCLRISGVDFDELYELDEDTPSRVGNRFSATLSCRMQFGGTLQDMMLQKCSLTVMDRMAWSAIVPTTLQNCDVEDTYLPDAP
ncbi:hypothetical protein PENSPDRAFT_757110 [Peniophora sp. CONT]|nr:hypothetical protein PENSPDRAFT_757110 [Peniophora sp. CONT]